MKILFWVIAGLTLAVGLTLAAQVNDGLVVLVVPPYRLTLSLNLFVLLILALFLLLHGLLRLAHHMLALPGHVREFKASRRRAKAQDAFKAALSAFFEGRFAMAEKNAATAAAQGESPALSALLAARAAHEQHAFERRDAYLADAAQDDEEAAMPRLITQAEQLLDERRAQEALALLKDAERLGGRKHSHALRLELKALQQARQWDSVPAVIAQLAKRDGLEPEQARQLLITAHSEALRRRADDLASLKEYWNKISADLRLLNKLALTGAQCFASAGDSPSAVEIAGKSLDESWDSELARFYGDCFAADGLKQIERAENWLKDHPLDASLLLSLAKLCARQELWGKARSFLEASLGVEPSAEAHLLMAEMLQRLGQPEEACAHYKFSLELCRQPLNPDALCGAKAKH